MQIKLPPNNLNTFAAAAEHLSFLKAAEALFVSPSAVSHQIRNLESILGYKLFVRIDKGVELTAEGEKLYQEIREPLVRLREASNRALRGTENSRLAISVAPVFATGWLLPRLQTFYQSHPEVSLSVVATTQVIDLHNTPFDAAIRLGRGDWSDLESCRLMNREIIAVCARATWERSGGEILSDRRIKYPLIHNASTPNVWRDWLISAGLEAPESMPGLQVQDSAQVVEAIQAGNAIGLVDPNLFPQDLASGRLVQAHPHTLRDDYGYYLVYPAVAESQTCLEKFRDWIISR